MKTRGPYLIVDDDTAIRTSVAHLLTLDGQEVRCYSSGEEFVRSAEEFEHPLIFVDLHLPGMQGLELLAWIQLHRPDAHAVIMTAHGDVHTAVEALRLGALDFILKPFTAQEFRIALRFVHDHIEHLSLQRLDTAELLKNATRSMQDGDLIGAEQLLRMVLARIPDSAIPFNLLGAIREMQARYSDAFTFYRTASVIDPTYRPAKRNLDRLTTFPHRGGIILSDQ